MRYLYTAIFSNYDTLQPVALPQGWKALCFTDSHDMHAKGWETVHTEPYAKAFRHIKICPHLFLPEDNELSLWVDGNLVPQMPLNHIVGNKVGYWVMEHPHRRSVWAEAARCIELRKDDEHVIGDQVDKYRKEGYKDNNGMVATGVLIRTPGHERFAEAWWQEVWRHSVRDQISFPVIAQRHKLPFRKFPFLQGFKRIVHSGK